MDAQGYGEPIAGAVKATIKAMACLGFSIGLLIGGVAVLVTYLLMR